MAQFERLGLLLIESSIERISSFIEQKEFFTGDEALEEPVDGSICRASSSTDDNTERGNEGVGFIRINFMPNMVGLPDRLLLVFVKLIGLQLPH